MTASPRISPGTVSKILWHFTGGPIWNESEQKQSTAPKPAASAYKNLKSIIASRELRLGKYKEIMRVRLPETRRYEKQKSAFITIPARIIPIESVPICCVSDIPAPHLRYHSYRYGAFAIGFYRDAVIKAGFNPVFYTLEDTQIIRSIYEGFATLEETDLQSLVSELGDISMALGTVDDAFSDEASSIEFDVSSAESDAQQLDESMRVARASLRQFTAFVKTFSHDEFATIYCEREWRSTNCYQFELEDVAMIVLPKAVGKNKYFLPFVKTVAPRIGLPRSIPIVPWDDLIEH